MLSTYDISQLSGQEEILKSPCPKNAFLPYLGINKLVDFWKALISRKALVPGFHLLLGVWTTLWWVGIDFLGLFIPIEVRAGCLTAAGNGFLATGTFLTGVFLVGDDFLAVAEAAADEAVVKNPEESESSESEDDSRASLAASGAAFDFGISFLLKVFLLLGSGVFPGVVFRSLLALAMTATSSKFQKNFTWFFNVLSICRVRRMISPPCTDLFLSNFKEIRASKSGTRFYINENKLPVLTKAKKVKNWYHNTPSNNFVAFSRKKNWITKTEGKHPKISTSLILRFLTLVTFWHRFVWVFDWRSRSSKLKRRKIPV